MQHAAIDSNSTTPIFTGIFFSSVSPSSNSFDQYKAYRAQHSAPVLASSAQKKCLCFAPGYCGTESGISALLQVASTVFMYSLMIACDKEKIFKYVSSDARSAVHTLGLGTWGMALAHV
ncbi:MAG TPA: hypothetical protein VEP71_04575 [Gallionella sp.]|nr:hypothetical protein [Gallionella sp.]